MCEVVHSWRAAQNHIHLKKLIGMSQLRFKEITLKIFQPEFLHEL